MLYEKWRRRHGRLHFFLILLLVFVEWHSGRHLIDFLSDILQNGLVLFKALDLLRSRSLARLEAKRFDVGVA